jgi:hypothetical protein
MAPSSALHPAAFDTSDLRTASDNDALPYAERHVTLLRIAASGTVTQAKRITEKRKMLAALRDGDLLLAAWTGNYSTDIFVVDNVDLARDYLA